MVNKQMQSQAYLQLIDECSGQIQTTRIGLTAFLKT